MTVEYDEKTEAYRRHAKDAVAEFLSRTGYLEFDLLIRHVRDNLLDEPEREKLTDLIKAIAFLDDDLLAWIKEGKQ
jgi:succinate dehydrogenase flavin-adding protein (antitoxin of CptAB toxin-antitoxin module)